MDGHWNGKVYSVELTPDEVNTILQAVMSSANDSLKKHEAIVDGFKRARYCECERCLYGA